MPKQFANPKAPLLVYGIREIVDVAHKIKALDSELNLIWENIGDPIAKGWNVPPFLKEILIEEISKPGDKSFGYAHSRGHMETRQWAAEYVKKFCPSVDIGFEDILFTNGLGAGISMLYQMLAPGSRILQPAPTYPTHASFESFAAGEPPILYRLDPDNNWEPDIANIEEQIKANPGVVGINIINPNNPTGSVYSKEVLEKVITIAEKHSLMIFSDEIYFRLVFSGKEHVHMAELAHNRVPLVVLRGLSKDVPWPGGRCGWIEFHNTHLSKEFKQYCESVKKRVLLEVCATMLPQMILPRIYNHPNFPAWNASYTEELHGVADDIGETLKQIPELLVNKTEGAFYMMPRFKDGVLNNKQTLPIKNAAVRKLVEEAVSAANFPLDKRFTYYLLAHTGIVSVPASDFFSPTPGFRLTTLERDPAKRKQTYEMFVQATKQYLAS